MRFQILSVLAITALGAETPPGLHDLTTHFKRDLATIQGIITQVGDALKKLDTTVKAFDGSDLQQITTDSSNLINSLQQGSQQIQSTTALSLQDALGLQGSVTTLQGSGQAVVDDMTSKKALFENAGLCDVVRALLSNVSDSSQALINATISKVPQEAQAVAGSLAGGVTDTLKTGQAAFAQGNCTNKATPQQAGGGGAPDSASMPMPMPMPASSPTEAAAGGAGMGTPVPATVTVMMPSPCNGSSGEKSTPKTTPDPGMPKPKPGNATTPNPAPPAVVTAAAAVNTFGPMAAVAGIFAIIML